MRTWASLPGTLRYPSSVTRRGGRLYGHICEKAAAGGLSVRSDVGICTLCQRRPNLENAEVLHACGLRIAALTPKRTFSSTPHRQILLEDDEEEDFEDSTSKRRGGRIGRSGVGYSDMSSLLRSRQPANRGQQNPVKPKGQPEDDIRQKPLNTEEIRRIEKKVLSLRFPTDLALTYLHLKYVGLEDEVWRCAETNAKFEAEYGEVVFARLARVEAAVSRTPTANRLLEHEYCTIVFQTTPKLTDDVSQLADNICKLRQEVFINRSTFLGFQIEALRVSLMELKEKIDEEYWEPRRSARAKIDRLLKETEEIDRQYAQLRFKSLPVENTLEKIRAMCMALSKHQCFAPEDRLDFASHGNRFFHDRTAFCFAAHNYRAVWLQRKRRRHPLGDSELLRFRESAGPQIQRTHLTKEEVISSIALGRHASRRMTRNLEMRPSVVAAQFWRKYMQRFKELKPARSPELNIFWRQLDVMAPFILLELLSWRMSAEAWYLGHALRGKMGPLWSWFPGDNALDHGDNILDWAAKFTAHRKSMRKELDGFTHINWCRLQLEGRLHELREPDVIRERGLFVPPNPLSQDLARFRQWVNRLGALIFEGSVINLAIKLPAEFWLRLAEKLEQHKSQESQELQEFQASQVLDLGSVRCGRKKKAGNRLPSSIRRPIQLSRRGSFKFLHHWRCQSRSRFNSLYQPSRKRKSQNSAAKERQKGAFVSRHRPTRKITKSKPKKSSHKKRKGPPTVHKAKDSPRKHNQARVAPGSRKVKSNKARVSDATKKAGHRKANLKSIKSHQPKGGAGQSPQENPKPGQHDSAEISPDSNAAGSKKNRAHAKPASTYPTRKAKRHTAKAKSSESYQREAGSSTAKDSRTTASSISNARTRDIRSSSSALHRKSWQGKHSAAAPQSRRFYSTDTTLYHGNSQGCSNANRASLPKGQPRLEIPSVAFTNNSNQSQPIAQDVFEPVTSPEASSGTNDTSAPQFWSHKLHRAPDGQKIVVHYCRSLRNTEEVARLFLKNEIVGFDMEWKAQAFGSGSIQNNLSLIQIANEERIALFQIALFKPARTLEDFVAPSLKRLLESPDITKVGVSIKADCTRLRRYLDIDARAIFELSHLYKLVKHGQANPRLVNKRSVNLSDQIEEHFGLPLEKSDEVRCGDWTRALNYRQVQYAATDPYACLRLFEAMELKRQAMDPVPPRPAHAELNLPIVLPHGQAVNTDDREPVTSDQDDVDAFNGS